MNLAIACATAVTIATKAEIKVTKPQGLQGRFVKITTRKCVAVTKRFTK